MYKYCPQCSQKYQSIGKIDKYICKYCGYILYNNPKLVVNGFILRPEDQTLLLVRRAKEPYKGYWGIPGGFVSYGEEPKQALRREMKEELGVDVKIGNVLGTFNEFYYNQGKSNECYSTITLVYSVQIIHRKKMRLSKEITDVGFFERKKIPKEIAFTNQRKFLLNNVIRSN